MYWWNEMSAYLNTFLFLFLKTEDILHMAQYSASNAMCNTLLCICCVWVWKYTNPLLQKSNSCEIKHFTYDHEQQHLSSTARCRMYNIHMSRFWYYYWTVFVHLKSCRDRYLLFNLCVNYQSYCGRCLHVQYMQNYHWYDVEACWYL